MTFKPVLTIVETGGQWPRVIITQWISAGQRSALCNQWGVIECLLMRVNFTLSVRGTVTGARVTVEWARVNRIIVARVRLLTAGWMGRGRPVAGRGSVRRGTGDVAPDPGVNGSGVTSTSVGPSRDWPVRGCSGRVIGQGWRWTSVRMDTSPNWRTTDLSQVMICPAVSTGFK